VKKWKNGKRGIKIKILLIVLVRMESSMSVIHGRIIVTVGNQYYGRNY